MFPTFHNFRFKRKLDAFIIHECRGERTVIYGYLEIMKMIMGHGVWGFFARANSTSFFLSLSFFPFAKEPLRSSNTLSLYARVRFPSRCKIRSRRRGGSRDVNSDGVNGFIPPGGRREVALVSHWDTRRKNRPALFYGTAFPARFGRRDVAADGNKFARPCST